jgi:hypothetical protein
MSQAEKAPAFFVAKAWIGTRRAGPWIDEFMDALAGADCGGCAVAHEDGEEDGTRIEIECWGFDDKAKTLHDVTLEQRELVSEWVCQNAERAEFSEIKAAA